MLTLYCSNCESVVWEGPWGRKAQDAQDFHEFDHGHTVLEFVQAGDTLLQITETVTL